MAKHLKHAWYLTFCFKMRSGRRRNDNKEIDVVEQKEKSRKNVIGR